MICRVTREHINKGVRESCTNCPIALAISDAMDVPGIWYNVGHHQVVAGRPRDGLPSQTYGNPVFALPMECDRFIFQFDGCYFEGDKEKIMTFEFEIPDSFVQAVREKFL